MGRAIRQIKVKLRLTIAYNHLFLTKYSTIIFDIPRLPSLPTTILHFEQTRHMQYKQQLIRFINAERKRPQCHICTLYISTLNVLSLPYLCALSFKHFPTTTSSSFAALPPKIFGSSDLITGVHLPEYDDGKSISTLLVTPKKRGKRSIGRRCRGIHHNHRAFARVLQQQREHRIVRIEIKRRRVRSRQLRPSKPDPIAYRARDAEGKQRSRVVEHAEARTGRFPVHRGLVERADLAVIQRRRRRRERQRGEELVAYPQNVETWKPMKIWR